MAIEEMYLNDRRKVLILVQGGKYYPWALMKEPYNEERILKKFNGRVPAGFAPLANLELDGYVKVYPKVAGDGLPKAVEKKKPKLLEVTKAWYFAGYVFFKLKGERTLIKIYVGFWQFDLGDAYRKVRLLKESGLNPDVGKYEWVEDGTLGQHNRISLAGLVQY
jgi:hypothetical protein